MDEIDPIAELKAIDSEEQEIISENKWFKNLTLYVILAALILGMILFLVACEDIQPRCLFSDTNERCALLNRA